MTTTALRPRSVGEILDAGIKVYTGNARTLMGLAAVVVIPMELISGVVLLSTIPSGKDIPGGTFSFGRTTVPDPAAYLGAEAVIAFVSLIVTLLTAAACVKAVSDAYMDQPSDFGSSLRFAVRRLPALIGMEILLVLGLIAGFIPLVVPGIWLFGLWSVSSPALLIEGRGPAGALGRSAALVKGNWWRTAGVLIVAAIMVAFVAGAFQALLVGVASLPSNRSVLLAVSVVVVSQMISTIVAQPFHACVLTILYYDLRVRHEGYDLQVLASQLGLPEIATQGAAVPAGALGPSIMPVPPAGPESVGQPGGPPYWPPPPGWTPGS